MCVTVKFVGAFRGITGKNKICIKIGKKISLRNFIEKLVEEQPQLRKVLLDPAFNDPRPNTLILVDGKEISILNGLETILSDKAEVVFVPVVHGG